MLDMKRLLRTKDFVGSGVSGPEIEDLLRETLVKVAKDRCGWDVHQTATDQPARRLVDILTKEASGFSKVKLARAFLSWLGEHGFAALTGEEQAAVKGFFTAVNKALS